MSIFPSTRVTTIRFCMVCDRRGCFLFFVNIEDVGLCLVCEACDAYYGSETW